MMPARNPEYIGGLFAAGGNWLFAIDEPFGIPA